MQGHRRRWRWTRAVTQAPNASAAVPDNLHKRGLAHAQQKRPAYRRAVCALGNGRRALHRLGQGPRDPSKRHTARRRWCLRLRPRSFALSAAELRRAGFGAADIVWEPNLKFSIPTLLYASTPTCSSTSCGRSRARCSKCSTTCARFTGRPVLVSDGSPAVQTAVGGTVAPRGRGTAVLIRQHRRHQPPPGLAITSFSLLSAASYPWRRACCRNYS